MSKREQVCEDDRTGELGRENGCVRKRKHVSGEENTGEGGRENR